MVQKATVSVSPTGAKHTHPIDPDCGYPLSHFEERVDHEYDVNFSTGRQLVGTTVVALTDKENVRAETSITIYSSLLNEDAIWISLDQTLTCDVNNDTDGFPILPGSSISIPIRDPSIIYLKAENGNQKVWWITI